MKTNREMFNLKSTVKRIQCVNFPNTKSVFGIVEKGEKGLTYIATFDENGNLISEESLRHDSYKRVVKRRYNYDSNNVLGTVTEMDNSGKITFVEYFTYNQIGLLVDFTKKNINGKIFEMKEFVYNSDNLLTKEILYYEDKTIDRTNEYFYELKRLKKMITTFSDSTKKTENYIYDLYDQVIEIIYEEENEKPWSHIHTYKNDLRGNWVKEIAYFKQGIIKYAVSVTERIIVYN